MLVIIPSERLRKKKLKLKLPKRPKKSTKIEEYLLRYTGQTAEIQTGISSRKWPVNLA
jgi:hypothetical protein